MFPVKVETRILLNCPHCRFSSRYDTGFLQDAIHDHKCISCVACGGHFEIVIQKAVEQKHTPDAEESTEQIFPAKFYPLIPFPAPRKHRKVTEKRMKRK